MSNPESKKDVSLEIRTHKQSSQPSFLSEDENSTNPDIKSSIFNSLIKKLNMLSKKLDSIGVETRGLDRVQPYERSTNPTRQFLSAIGLWISATGGLSSMSTFFLGPLVFDLGLAPSLYAGIIGSTVGCGVAAYCSLMGPRSGCRQMVGARFAFGWWFVKLLALVSIIGVLGWSVVNCVVGGQILLAVSDGKIPLSIGIIIIAIISLVVAIFGIKQLLKVETAFALPVLISFLLLYITSSQEYQYLSNIDLLPNFKTKVGNFLSFLSLSYSCTATWGSIASDYLILFPETTPDYQIFTLTFLGIMIPTNFVGILGLLIGNVALSHTSWGDAYASNGMGGLLAAAYEPWGAGGKFLLVLLFLSLISNNIVNTYSAAFGMQLAGVFFAKIPRWIWAITVTGIYLACALIGRNKFSTILGNFLPMLGYWISMYFIILLEENSIFRTKRAIHLFTKEFINDDEVLHLEKNVRDIQTAKFYKKQYYNWNIWNDDTKLTHGFAAGLSFIIGATGAAVGMAQAYWTGPIAAKIGDYGGDIAMWLCMGFAGLVYPGLRYLELKKFGK